MQEPSFKVSNLTPGQTAFVDWLDDYLRRRRMFSFGAAIENLQSGLRVTRRGWNGRGMFLFFMPGYPNGVPANEATARAMGLAVGETVIVRPYLAMRTVDGSIVPWLASQTDVLATDWELV
jgi:hypothetical protein